METKFHYDQSLLPHYLQVLYSKLRIAVVYAGDKNKDGAVLYKTLNPRSWKSYEAVARDIQRTLQEIGFQHVFVMPDDQTLPANLKKEGIHLVWLNSGGVQGLNPMSHTPAMLEMLGVPYIGHGPLNAAVLDSKDTFKRELQAIGIKTARHLTWHPAHGPFDIRTNPRFARVFGEDGYSGPFVVKPVSGRASLHVYVVDSANELPEVVNEVYRATQNTVLIEQYLPGREFCVAVAGQMTCIKGRLVRFAQPFAFSALERVLEPDELIATSMDKKPITADRARLLKGDDGNIRQDLMELAQKVYREFDLKSLIRLDIRQDAHGILHVMEANPKPDLKRAEGDVVSLVSLGLSEHQMSYHDLILGLLADRLDYLFTYNRDSFPQIMDLIPRVRSVFTGPLVGYRNGQTNKLSPEKVA